MSKKRKYGISRIPYVTIDFEIVNKILNKTSIGLSLPISFTSTIMYINNATKNTAIIYHKINNLLSVNMRFLEITKYNWWFLLNVKIQLIVSLIFYLMFLNLNL